MTYLKGLFSVFLLIFLAGVVLFVDFTYKTFSLKPSIVETDAIVVLTGGKGRIEEGVKLYRQHAASYLFLIGVDPAVRKGDLFHERRGQRGGDRVVLEKASRNTLENAFYARDLIAANGIRSITLITSRYHMKRALLIFRSLLPKGIALYPCPVDSKNLKEEWWSHGGSFRLLFSEFYKYCVFRFFFFFGFTELRPSLGGG